MSQQRGMASLFRRTLQLRFISDSNRKKRGQPPDQVGTGAGRRYESNSLRAQVGAQIQDNSKEDAGGWLVYSRAILR
jgi:hypothetical protein